MDLHPIVNDFLTAKPKRGTASSPARSLLARLCLGICAIFWVPGGFFGQTPDSSARQSSTTNPAIEAEGTPAVSALLLDAGDLLDVRVFDTPELSGKLRVDERGEIILPIGGSVSVKGLTAEEAQTAVERCFHGNNILRDPHVEIFVLEYATQGVTVSGEVKSPGAYPWANKHTVADFISIAGGVTPSASRTVTVNRRDREQVMTFQLGNSPQTVSGADMQVQPGDRITVSRAGVVYVVGDVGRPGGYLIESNDTVTVLQALALAQGMNKTAKYSAKLIRNTPSGRTESDLALKKIFANQAVDPKLQDGDILFVPVSGSKQWAEKSITSIMQMAVGVVIYGTT
jgi:polysaccharide biosynthesis/export protein